MQQTDILCTTNQRPVSSDDGITDDSVRLCAVKWRRLLSSLIHWYWEREIIIYYFPNSLKDDVWASVHTCRRAAAGWSRCVNEHCDEREVRKSLIMLTTCSSLGSPQVTVKSFNPTELKHSRRRWPITASCVNTVVDAWRSRARDRPPHHINIQLCLQEMIDSQQQQQNTIKNKQLS